MCLLLDKTSQRTLNIMKDRSIIQIGGYFSWYNNMKRAQVRQRRQQKRRLKRICAVSSFIAIIVSRARKFSGAQFLKTISKVRKTKTKIIVLCWRPPLKKRERNLEISRCSRKFSLPSPQAHFTCASLGKLLAADRPRRMGCHSSSSRLRQLKLAPPPSQFSHNDGDSWEKAT